MGSDKFVTHATDNIYLFIFNEYYVKNEVPKPFKVPNLATQSVISANM